MNTPGSALPPAARDKLLFTPGPLTTSSSVKEAMLHDAGSWHWEFNTKVQRIRERLLALAGVRQDRGWECVLLQGSGTFGVESVFQTCVPPDGKATRDGSAPMHRASATRARCLITAASTADA